MVVGDAGEFGQAGNIDQDGGRLQAKGQHAIRELMDSETFMAAFGGTDQPLPLPLAVALLRAAGSCTLLRIAGFQFGKRRCFKGFRVTSCLKDHLTTSSSRSATQFRPNSRDR